MSSPAIVIHHLTCRFRKTVAVNDLSLEVPQGKIYGFLGENGAGKTTTIRVLMGLLRPASGFVKVQDADPLGGNPALLQRIGYVSEDRAMYRWMKVSEVLRFNGGLYKNWDRDYAERLRQEFELEPSMKVGSLSRGQLAKLALLCALAPQPELLILDEASSGLDPIVRRVILEKLIDAASSRGTTIFFSSHLVEEVDRIAEEVAILCRGKLIIAGEKDRIRGSLKRVIFDGAPTPQPPLAQDEWVLSSRQANGEVQLIVRDLDEAGLSGLTKRFERKPTVVELSLEDVFAEYTAWAKRKRE